MIVCNNDNAKIPLEKQQAYVINNNSKVFIAQNNTFGGQGEVDTITINKGNTISLLSSLSSNYDILYGNSVFSSKNKNFEESQHEWLIDYNFPAARYNVNGYKSNYAILLNNGTYPYWTKTNKGVLLGDITANDIDKIPTRMNGYTAIVNSFTQSVLSGKYNGVLVINKFNKALTSDFIFNLQLTNDGSRVFTDNNTFQFNNITYLFIKGGLDYANVILKNVRYSLFSTNGTITLQNSNIAVNKVNSISTDSFNTVVSYNVESVEYRNYILSGVHPESISIDGLNRNILYGAKRYQKQTLHPYNTDSGYNSNLPIGAVIWYPEVWSAFNPAHDKNDTQNPRFILTRGEPDTDDWQICSGATVPSDCLYTQIYGETKTPDYRVLEKFYKNQPATVSGHHYLTQQSLIQFFPSSVVSAYPTSVGVAHDLDEQGGDNKHKSNWVWVRQKLSGAYDLQMQVKGNWRCHGVVNVKFSIDLSQLGTDPYLVKQNFALQFDSYCCMGSNWWNGWTGGNLNGQGQAVGRNNDTINVPKLAVRLHPNHSTGVTLTEVTGNGNRLFNEVSNNLRAYYNASHSIVKNMKLDTNPDGGGDYTPCTDRILTPNLPYLLKTYRITLNSLPVLENRLQFVVQFQLALPSTVGYWRCKEGGGVSYQYTQRWFPARNRDNTQNGAPYHMFWQADYISVMSNIKICYNSIEIGVAPAKRSTTSRVGEGSWSNKDWPTTTNTKSVKGTFETVPNLNMGLYRRLNPWIKINDIGTKKNLPVEIDDDVKQWIDPVTLIKYRNNNVLTDQEITNLNVNKINGNRLFKCYGLTNWNNVKNNITEWEFKIERGELNDLYTLQEDNTIKYSNGTTTVNCNVYTKIGDDKYKYIELLNGKTVQDLFPLTTVTIHLVDDQGNETSQTILESAYIGLNMQENTFATYRDLNYNTTTTNTQKLPYTYYDITNNGNEYLISINPDLIQLAANNKQLQNTIRAIKNEIAISGSDKYINTYNNSFPVFTYDAQTLAEQGMDWTSYFNLDSTQPVVSYPLLGTASRVLSAMYTVSSYAYQINYNEKTKEAKVGNYQHTRAIINQGTQNQQEEQEEGSAAEADLEVTLTAAVLKNNTDLTSGTYKFITILSTASLQKAPAVVNLQIYNKINKYVKALNTSLNATIDTIEDLSATNYDHYLSTYAAGTYTYETNVNNVKAISGLPNI